MSCISRGSARGGISSNGRTNTKSSDAATFSVAVRFEPFNFTVAIDESMQKINFASDEAIAMRRVNAIHLFPRLRA